MAGKQESEATVAVNVEELRNSKDAVSLLFPLKSFLSFALPLVWPACQAR